jgi:hypothetical protein
VTTLTENEGPLVEVLRALPPCAADQVLTWTIRLRDLANGNNADWPDTPTKKDLASAQSLSSFDGNVRSAWANTRHIKNKHEVQET